MYLIVDCMQEKLQIFIYLEIFLIDFFIVVENLYWYFMYIKIYVIKISYNFDICINEGMGYLKVL